MCTGCEDAGSNRIDGPQVGPDVHPSRDRRRNRRSARQRRAENRRRATQAILPGSDCLQGRHAAPFTVDLPAPHVDDADVNCAECALDVSSETSQSGLESDSGTCTTASSAQRTGRVHFDDKLDHVIEISPYSEVYGIHPRDFVFDKRYRMVPAVNHIPVDVIAVRYASSLEAEECADSDASASETEDEEPCVEDDSGSVRACSVEPHFNSQ